MFAFISGGEIVIVLLAVLMLFGSKSIPDVARMLGKGMNEFRRATDELKREFREGAQGLDEEVTKVKRSINEEVKTIKKGVTEDLDTDEKSIVNNERETSIDAYASEESKPSVTHPNDLRSSGAVSRGDQIHD